MTTTIRPQDFYYIAPEIALTAWGLLVLLIDVALLRRRTTDARRRVLGYATLLGMLVTIGVSVAFAGLYLDVPWSTAVSYESEPYIFAGTISGDLLTFWMNLVIVALLAMVVGISMSWSFTDHWGEYYGLLCWAGVGMMLLVAADELLTLFLTLETMTLCLYMATAFEKGKRRSAEGGLKYFVYGSVSSALFLFGLSLVYGLAGSTRLEAIRLALSGPTGELANGLAGNVAGATAVLLLLVGFGFKVAAVPFHQWAPDAYEGAPAPVTAWIAAGSKLASFVAMMKVLVYALGPWASAPDRLTSPGWIGIVALIAAVTMTYGNFAALAQRNLKRMLAYSSIAHAGYILVGVLAASVSQNNAAAAGSVLFYLIVYGFTTVGAFALAAWLMRDTDGDEIDDLNGLGFRSPALAVCIVILMLSLIGMPPLAGFFGKLYMFMEALRTRESGHLTLIGLVALGLANSVVSAFYYVRILKAMFLRDPGRRPTNDAPGGVRWPIVVATLVAVGFGLYPAPLLETARGAAALMMPSRTASRYATQADPAGQERAKREKAEGPSIDSNEYGRRMQAASAAGPGNAAARQAVGTPAAPTQSGEAPAAPKDQPETKAQP